MEAFILNMLSSLDISTADIKSQSYDNAINMSWQYSGLQSLIKSHNLLAEFIPCSAHSLNLKATHAANCCLQVIKLFIIYNKT